jgi:hypothetical protein
VDQCDGLRHHVIVSDQSLVAGGCDLVNPASGGIVMIIGRVKSREESRSIYECGQRRSSSYISAR